jgi:hypothetical protein
MVVLSRYAQVGVIGECNRDGTRQSRLLRLTPEHYAVMTVDHDAPGSAPRLDLQHAWTDPSPPRPAVVTEELLCDPSSGWLCSRVDCDLDGPIGTPRWIPAGASIAAETDRAQWSNWLPDWPCHWAYCGPSARPLFGM